MTKLPVVLTGPTASGKTSLALSLARRLDGEIVNADSVQVYRGFDIGSAKPAAGELQAVPHHLVSAADPEEDYNAGRFRRDALAVIEDIRARGRVPIVSGGTGLYVRALLNGIVGTDEDPQSRLELEALEKQLKEEHDSEQAFRAAMHAKLAAVDAQIALRISPNDLSRIRRALLVHMSSGLRLSDLHQGHASTVLRSLVIVLLPEREVLYRKIDNRVQSMLDQGLIEEVERLRRSHSRSCKPFGALGYRQVLEYLEGKVEYARMVELIKRDTRRFAKRQYTWWRHQPERLGWVKITLQNELSDAESRDREVRGRQVRSGQTGNWEASNLQPTNRPLPEALCESIERIRSDIETGSEFAREAVYFAPVEYVDSSG